MMEMVARVVNDITVEDVTSKKVEAKEVLKPYTRPDGQPVDQENKQQGPLVKSGD